MEFIIVQADRNFSAHKKSSPSISRAIDKLLSVKASANLRAGYINSLRCYLNQFARGRTKKPIDHFTAADIERWFSKRKEAPTSRASNLGRLSSLFAFCQRRDWISDNPCLRVEHVRLDPKPPRILSVEETERIVFHCAKNEKDLLAYITLGLFAGLRPGELQNLSWDAIDLERGRVRIDATITKVRRMRWVKLPKNCLAWLKRCRKRRGKIAPLKSTCRRALRRLRKFMGWKSWPQDILRHTAASYFVAAREDVAAVARLLGTSVKILLTVYHQLVIEEDGRKYFRVRPSSTKSRRELFR